MSSWRKHATHAEETKAVKAALLAAGYTNVKVRHSTGTARAWLNVQANLKQGQTWSDRDTDILRIAQAITGRTGDYDGRINVGG